MLDFPRFNKRQLDKLSDIISDIGLVAFASVALPAMFDRIDATRIIFGLLIALVLWWISIRLGK